MTLRDAMEEGPFTIVDMLSTAIQIARALEYIQSKGVICHQDLKAENIFLDVISKKFVTDGNFPYQYQAYLADFDLINTAVIFCQPYGSRPYQAPEQYLKNEIPSYDKIDVFALAVNMVEMLTGGVHPVGVRTIDAWPDSSIGNKWNREDPWKKWARNPKLSDNLKIDIGDPLRRLISDMMTVDYFNRPNISEVKSRLLDCLSKYNRNAHDSLLLYIHQADDAAKLNTEAGWPYMDKLVMQINKLYESEL